MLKNENEALYSLALTLVAGIGATKAKNLIAYCGGAQEVFRTKPAHLMKIPDIGPKAIKAIRSAKDVFHRAEKELEFAQKFDVQILLHHTEGYPWRLRQCPDSPLILYFKGKGALQTERVISIVGTRSATTYGRQFIDRLLTDIKSYSPLVVSGLAYGVDICAHRVALDKGLSTVACLAHGLDRIYPPLHTPVAREMIETGGLLTEFPSGTRPDRELFPSRNRIIAGLSDCTIVVETDTRGGSIITAYIAQSYGREVFAVPGRVSDKHSSGCNMLIKKNVAAILNDSQDLVDYLNWGDTDTPKSKQLVLFSTFSNQQQQLIRLLQEHRRLPIDRISHDLTINLSRTSELLLQLEFEGVIKSLPGKMYELIPSLTFDM